MRPIVSSVRVERPCPEVFAHLDVAAHHEAFCDHYMRDWSFSGPPSGVGARSRLRVAAPGRTLWTTIEVRSAREPEEIVEESVDDTGTRRGRGTYRLTADGDGTRVTFTFEQLASPWADRLAGPLARRWLQKVNDRALARLAEQMAGTRPPA